MNHWLKNEKMCIRDSLHGFKELCHDHRHVAGNGPYAVIRIIAASDNRNLVNL